MLYYLYCYDRIVTVCVSIVICVVWVVEIVCDRDWLLLFVFMCFCCLIL